MIRAVMKFNDGSRKIDSLEKIQTRLVSERNIIEYQPQCYGNLVLHRSPTMREKVIFRLQHVVCDDNSVVAYYLEEYS